MDKDLYDISMAYIVYIFSYVAYMLVCVCVCLSVTKDIEQWKDGKNAEGRWVIVIKKVL